LFGQERKTPLRGLNPFPPFIPINGMLPQFLFSFVSLFFKSAIWEKKVEIISWEFHDGICEFRLKLKIQMLGPLLTPQISEVCVMSSKNCGLFLVRYEFLSISDQIK